MKKPKRPKIHLTRIEVAELMRLSASRVSQLTAERQLPQAPSGKYPLEMTLRAIIEIFREGHDLSALKAERLRRQNALLAREERQADSEFYLKEDAERAWSERAHAACELLRQTPVKIAPRIAYMRDEAEATAEFTKLVEEVCAELARPVDYTHDSARNGHNGAVHGGADGNGDNTTED